MKEPRNCSYRNCKADISEMRKDAKYCNRSCKCNEKIYIRRAKKSLENKLKDLKQN